VQGKFSFVNMAPGLAEFLIATTYGVFMTMGAFYVQTGYFTTQVFLISLPVAMLVTNVLLINQFQDAESDQKTQKNTLVVRVGKENAKNILISFFVMAYGIIAALPLMGYAPYSLYFTFLSVPFAIQAIRYVSKNYNKTAVDLISGNAHTAIAHLFAGLLLVFAFLLEGPQMVYPLVYLAASLLFVFWVWNYIESKRKAMDDFRQAIKG
ncbi:MAG TPA: prenyltransferase, partial [Saprospiraceae bacterium]|nr:prenyltransferase [Saprospiraceae bacterium]